MDEGFREGAAALYSDDGKLLTAAARLISGRTEIEAYWREGIGLGLSSLELEALDVQVVGGVAIEIGRYTLAVRDGSDAGKYVVLHRQQSDGSWRRVVDVFNPDEPTARSPRARAARRPRPEAR